MDKAAIAAVPLRLARGLCSEGVKSRVVTTAEFFGYSAKLIAILGVQQGHAATWLAASVVPLCLKFE